MAIEKLKTELVEVIKIQADYWALDWRLVAAIVIVESSGVSAVNRYEPKWRWYFNPSYWAKRLKITDKTEFINQAISWGPMQVMGAVARELGYKDNLPALIYPKTGIFYGCKKLHKLKIKYNEDIEDMIAAYNAGAARYRDGILLNHEYVDKVMNNYLDLKREDEAQ